MTRNRTDVHRSFVLGVNGLKAAIAVVFIVRPSVIEAWVGPTANDPGGRVLLRAFGIRDLFLAIGAMRARNALERRRWLIAGGACDLLDAVTTLTTTREARERMGSMTAVTTAWAALSGIVCLALAGNASASEDEGD